MKASAVIARPTVLAVNAGSSSLKFALFETDGPLQRVLEGEIKGVGSPGARLYVRGFDSADNLSEPVSAPDHSAASIALMSLIDRSGWHGNLSAVGHRLVHGGKDYSQPQRVDAAMLAGLRTVSAFDPEHLPQEILLLETFAQRFPKLPQIACFDTAFHHDMPRVAHLLPIPRRYDAQGIRRYGFHGLSYTFLMAELARIDGPEAAHGRVILAHLGSGASLAAVRNFKPIDTSMGLTPAGGAPMSTRSGDLDPGLGPYLARTEQMTARQFGEMVNFQSGLLGISETSSDMRQLLATEAGDIRAAEAVAVFCYQIKKWIGAFAAALGGLDTLIFAGGVGENAPIVRARICDGLGFLGIALDPDRNERAEQVISSDAGRVRVRVMHTDEQSVIASSVVSLLGLDTGMPGASIMPTFAATKVSAI